MGLEVDVHVGAAALQVVVLARGAPVPGFPPVGLHEGRPLLMVAVCLLAAKDNSFQNEDHEEACSYDELREGEADLLGQKCLTFQQN